MRRRLLAGVAALVLVGGCGEDGGSEGGPAAGSSEASTQAQPSVTPATDPPERYEPDRAEEFPNGKRLASRVAERALTYRPGASPRDLAGSLPRSQVSKAELARVLEPVVDPAMRSTGTVVYPQLSGVTETSLGAMVIARQILEAPDGRSRAITRVLDIRLRLSAGAWSLERIASVGGSPARRPASLPSPARRVLDNPNITLSDSARWDIYRGVTDTSLLRALASAAKHHELSVGILLSGHPPNVWGTSRPRAHSQGFAADIYAVDGRPVVRQRRTGSPAYDLAQRLFAGGATQLGSPWVFGGGGPRSFTDPVHQDHLHLQQSPAS